MGFPRQKSWSKALFHSPGDRPNPGTESTSPALTSQFFTSERPGKPHTGGIHVLQLFLFAFLLLICLACLRAKSLQSCLTLCNPMDCSPPGSSVHGILQARILAWVARSSSRGSSQPRDRIHFFSVSCIGTLPLAPPGKPVNLSCMFVSHSVMSNCLRLHGLYPARFLCPWNSPCKNTGVGCHFLLQGIFLTQGLNPGLLYWQVDSLPSDPPG